MNIDTKELAAAIATAIVEANKPAAPVASETITVGYNSDPKLDAQLFCNGCLRGEPFYPNERVQLLGNVGGQGIAKDERGRPIREDGGVVYLQGADGTPTGGRRAVSKIISYDLESARALVAKGKLERCIHCGQKRDEAVAYDGRRG